VGREKFCQTIRADALGRGAKLPDLDHPPVAADADDPAVEHLQAAGG